jgi:hypothetical protein
MDGVREETVRDERYANGRIQVWRQKDGHSWFVSILPDDRAGVPGYTFARQHLPGDVPDEPDALLAWARDRAATLAGGNP